MPQRDKRWKPLSAVAVALAVWLVALPAAAGAARPTAGYTVMVFMNGSDLESDGGSATRDLQELMQVGSGPHLNVVVETLGTLQWHTPGIDGERNQRWLVRKGRLELVDDRLGTRPLGDPATLTDFIVWSVRNYPADRYALILWNHGAGSVDGYGFDENDGGSLSLGGIREAIADAVAATGARLEVIGFDACLLATVELASAVSPFAAYMVASEEVEPGHGWDYKPILQAIADDPAIPGDRLGQVIADGYKAQAVQEEQDQEITLSVVDLARVARVVSALEGLVRATGQDVRDVDRIVTIARARSAAEDYGNAPDDATDMVDLGDLARKAAGAYPDATAPLIASLTDAVVYRITSPGKPNASGLSVYFPMKDREGFARKLETYLEQTPFSATYKDFVRSFGTTLFEDRTPVQFAGGPATEGDEGPGGASSEGSAWVDPEQAGEVAEVYSVVARVEGDGSRMVFLGMDNDVEFDPETGEIVDSFTGMTVTLNGHQVSMFFDDEGDEYSEYSIPIKLNGEEVDLKVLYSFETGEDEIIGAWPGVDDDTHMAAKNLIKVKRGDRIVPQFYYYDEETGEDGYEDGPEFIVREPLRLDWTELPAGTYLYGFYVIDYAGNESVSDFTEVTVEDGVSG